MSLLMQALKKAESAKQKQDVPVAEGTPDHSTSAPGPGPEDAMSLTPMEPAASPPTSSPEAEKQDELLPIVIQPDAHELALFPQTEEKSTTPIRVEPTLEMQAQKETFPEIQVLTPMAKPPVPDTAAQVHAEPVAPASAPQENKARQEPVREQVSEQKGPPAAGNLARPPEIRTGTEKQQAAAQEEQKISAARQTAKSVFVSKQAPRRSRFLLIGMVAILVSGAGLGLLYWKNMFQNSSTLVVGVSNPQATPPNAPIETAANTGAATVTKAATKVPNDTPELTQKAAIAKNRAAPEESTNPPVEKKHIPPGLIAEVQGIKVRQSSDATQVNPSLNNAYQSFIAGDMTSAQQQYEKVLRQEPNNRDALLGMAAIAMNHKQAGPASAIYLRLLELDPADSDAIAALTSMQQGDTAQSESRLKKILAQNPNAGAVLFVLGNLYARQSRWADAQQTYFRAFGSAPDNPDYAFNLAVSLDRLSQGKLALDYYQRALTLNKADQGNFNNNTVQNRITELQKPASN